MQLNRAMFVRSFIATAISVLMALSSSADWTYTETNTVQNGTSKGSITDGVWTFYAERAKGVKDELTIDARNGVSNKLAQPAKIDFTQIKDGYKVIKFIGVNNTKSPLVLYTTEFIAPHCLNLSGQGIFYPGNANNTTLTKIALRQDAAVTLGNGLMFMNCTSLTSFTPKRITNIELQENMFSGCSRLEGEFEFPNCTLFHGNAFNGCAVIGGIKATNLVTIGQSAFNGCVSLSNIVVSPLVLKINRSAFKNCKKISTGFVQGLLNRSLTTLQDDAFLNCTGLTGTLVWDCPKLTTIPGSCFSGCSSLERVEIKSHVDEIKNSAFFNLKNGAEVFLPKSPVAKYGLSAVASSNAPFPRVYISDDVEGWLKVMYEATQNHLMRKEEFGDTTWVSKHMNDVSWGRNIGGKIKSDTTMYKDDKVLDKNVVAFIMGYVNNGCWVLKRPKIGFSIRVR